MATTSILGTSLSVLGDSMILGSAGEAPPPGSSESVTQSLGLFDEANFFLVISDRQVHEDVLNLTQSALASNFPDVEQELNLVQEAEHNFKYGIVSQKIGWEQFAQPCFSVPWNGVSVSQSLSLVQQLSKGKSESVSQSLNLTQTVTHLANQLIQFLNLSQTVDVGFGLDVADVLSLTQILDTQSDFLRTAEHTNILKQAMTFYIDSPCYQKSYAKFDGEGEGTGLDAKRLTFDGTFSLETLTGPKTILILRSPETDDRDRLGFNRINRETRGGELNVFSDPTWAKVNTLLFTIVAVTDGKGGCPDRITALLDFLQDTLGQEIKLHDWTGVTWKGVVTTPNEAATEDRDGYWTVTFEFEGIALPGSSPDNTLSLSHTVGLNADWTRTATDSLNLAQTATVGGDINISVSQSIAFSQSMGGTQEIIILDDDFTAGSGAANLNATSPTTGSGLWRAHENFKDDGTQSGITNAGAYYAFTPAQGTRYELTLESFEEITSNNGDSIIAGFYEDISSSSTIIGITADGTTDPTTLKAGFARKDVGGSASHGYRRGTDSDGEADTQPWSDNSLRTSASTALDMRLILDTIEGGGNWTAQWLAKETVDPTYTEVGAEASLYDESIGAVGWSNDSPNTVMACDRITLKELRPI